MVALAEILDRAILKTFPGWGAKRLAVRRRLEFAEKVHKRQVDQLQAHWDAADNDRIRAEKFMRSGLSTESALESDLETLRSRSRELYRVDPFAASFIEGRTNNIVGRGIRPQPRIAADDESGLGEDQAKACNRALIRDFKRWCKRAGRNGESFWAIQRLAQRSWDIDGETFIVVTHEDNPQKPFPLALEVVDAERVSTPPQEAGNILIRMGVERAYLGGPVVAYWIRSSEPGDTKDLRLTWTRHAVANENGLPNIIHCFEKLFPGQTRGIPAMTPAITKLKDRKDYDETVLIAEQAAACFAAFVKSSTDPDDLAISSASETLPHAGAGGRNVRLQDLNPGTIQYLQSDQDITFANPNRPSGTFGPFMEYHLRSIAAALSYPYELLVKDWTGLSYAGGRLSLIDGRITFGCRQQLLGEQMLDGVWSWVVNQSMLFGSLGQLIEMSVYRSMPWLFTAVGWIANGWPWIDPAKEVQAAALAVEGNLSTLTQELASRGQDLEETLETRAYERELLGELGLPLAMPMMNRDLADPNAASQPASATGQTAEPDDEELPAGDPDSTRE